MWIRSILAAGVLVAISQVSSAADLRIGLAADITAIDPHAINITPNNTIGWHVFDALTHVDENTRLVPGLAESWRAIDSTTWEFKLRRGVKFHDGSELTADDVLFSLERPLKVASGQFNTFVQRLTVREAPDRYTIRVKTATPYAMVPYDLNSIFIVSKKAATGASTEDFNAGRAMIGTGPFKFARFARGDRVELTRNDDYWGGKAAWEKVTFRVMPADPSRLAALLAGDVDVIEAIPTADIAKLRTNAKYTLAQKVSWRTIFFHLDQQREPAPGVMDKGGKPLAKNPFKDVRVRQAISMSLNRTAIVERVMENAAIPASNLVSPPVFGHVSTLKPEGYDVEGAKKLLAQAGYPQGFDVQLGAPNNRYVNDDQVAQAVAQMLTRIGITTKVETRPMSAYLPKARDGGYSLAMLGWGSFSGDLAMRSLVASPDAKKGFGTWNWSGYANPKLDALIEQGFALTDDKKREALAQEAMTLAMRDYAVIPVHHQIATWAMRAGLKFSGRTDEYTFAHQIKP